MDEGKAPPVLNRRQARTELVLLAHRINGNLLALAQINAERLKVEQAQLVIAQEQIAIAREQMQMARDARATLAAQQSDTARLTERLLDTVLERFAGVARAAPSTDAIPALERAEEPEPPLRGLRVG